MRETRWLSGILRIPGGIVKRQSLEPLGCRSRALRSTSVSPGSPFPNSPTSGVSVDMAIRLSKAFGSTPDTWVGMHMPYDLWQARSRIDDIKIDRIEAA